MKHLLDVCDLSCQEINALIQRGIYFKQHAQYPQYPQLTMANLFYENSTRTRVSFEMAANALGIRVVNLDLNRSSESKGEMIEDTVNTLAAMGIRLFVIRHAQDDLPAHLAAHCNGQVQIINAGDGRHAHPSQALLDMMTIVENKPDLQQLKIAIVGNLRHSRVANSFQHIAARMGVGELVLVAPEIWQPQTVHFGHVTESLQDGLAGADVVICLRVQQERLGKDEQVDPDVIRQQYALTRSTLALAKPDAMVMHPGPVNRGVELDSDVADSPRSFILQQVANGVFMRMAILEALATESARSV